jgi:hypothetical protein
MGLARLSLVCTLSYGPTRVTLEPIMFEPQFFSPLSARWCNGENLWPSQRMLVPSSLVPVKASSAKKKTVRPFHRGMNHCPNPLVTDP